ncbi:hypothetical protein [Streptomyces avicenniae]|uniref:hypothetical protein n=1 Tax=Streptomyces avicenniae TaxID=500153 RepID=UPI000699BC25|nr:hypothetical protein [Streptomyces avicenniae]
MATTPPLSLPHWMPLDGRLRIRPLGEEFDAVRVPALQGLYVLPRLALTGLSGPVVEDPVQRVLHWLVPVGAANGRWWPGGVVPLGRGHVLAIPPADRVHGLWDGDADAEVRWLTFRPSGDCLTDPDVLYGALVRVFGEVGHG